MPENLEQRFYCPECKEEQQFIRIDVGIALIGAYQCNKCKRTYQENQLTGEEFVDLIRRKIKQARK